MPRESKEPVFSDPNCRSFKFTEQRVRDACRAVADGEVATDASGRVQWRDTETPGLFLRVTRNGTGTFTLFYKRDGKPVRKAIGSAADVAVAEAREAVQGLRYDRTLAAQVKPRERAERNGPTIGEAFDLYISDAEAGLFTLGRRKQPITDRTAKNYRDTFTATLKKHEDESLVWLAENIVKLHRQLGTASGSGKKKIAARPVQANRMMQTARNVFAFAASKGLWSRPNPCVDPATGGMIAKFPEHHRDRILTDDEEARLGAELLKEPELWRHLFALALLTGRRMSAVCRMQWGDVDLGRAVWTVPRHNMKGRKSAHGLKLDADAVAILKRRRAATSGSEWVFPAIRSPGPVGTWKTAWGRIRDRAGLNHKDRARRVVPHDLRRSWGSRLIEAGVPTVTVNTLLGNSAGSVGMTARTYLHVPDAVQAEAIEAAYRQRKARVARAKAKAKRASKRAKAKA